MITLLNSPRLTDFGSYEYRCISLDEVRQMIEYGFESAIGHQVTARILSELLSAPIPRRRISYRQRPGESVIVFELRKRLPEGTILGLSEINDIGYRFGLLTRTS